MIILTKACLSPTHPPGVHHPPTERRNPTRRRHNCDATPQCLPEHAGQLPRKHTPPGNRIATVGDRWQNTGENVSAREPRYRRASSLQTSSIRRPIHEPRRPTVTNVVQTADISAFCRNTRLRWTTFVTHKQKEPLQEHRTKRPDPHVLKRAPRPPPHEPPDYHVHQHYPKRIALRGSLRAGSAPRRGRFIPRLTDSACRRRQTAVAAPHSGALLPFPTQA